MELLKKEGYLFVILICPYIHLIDQWVSECEKFHLDSVKCYESSARWQRALRDKLKKLSMRKSLQMDGPRVLVAAVSIASFVSKKFQTLLSETKIPTFLIADEVHNLGSTENLKMLPENVEFRLGLSATPERWYDAPGTIAINRYFKGKVFALNLKDAIYQYDILCKYNYIIYPIELEDEELESYKSISVKIAQALHKAKKSNLDELNDRLLGHLLRERANILNNARQKLPLLRNLLTEQDDIDYTLIYTSPQQIRDVNKILSDMHIISHQITYQESVKERANIFEAFEKGLYKVLTAIKCLDEGVDIPKVKTAYLLASTGNPREFTQRRGRILRKSEGKKLAAIVDFVTVPTLNPNVLNDEALWVERTILRREFARFGHFAECAENKHEAILAVYDLASLYGVQDLLLGG
jgi:superfamily II DNA or RNA helicase